MSSTSVDILSYTRTVWGSYLQAINWPGIGYEMFANSTLNEKFNIQSGVAPDAGERPVMRYMAIGNRGHQYAVEKDGSEVPIPVPHTARHAACYNHIPFVIREVNDDLPAEKRQRYGLRRIETINNRQYVVYYLRRLDFSTAKGSISKLQTKDNATSDAVFDSKSADLSPTPPNIATDGTNVGSDTSYISAVVTKLTLDEFDIEEIIKANYIRTGSNRSPVISEIALCSGIDHQAELQSGSGTYNEVIACQVNMFVYTFQAVSYASKGIDMTIDIGGSEPEVGTARLGG